jgi:hypothetical protein
MQPVGGTPARLSWIAETVLGGLGALGVEATALQPSGRCFLSGRDVVAALDELERRGFVERVGRRWRATDTERADGARRGLIQRRLRPSSTATAGS